MVEYEHSGDAALDRSFSALSDPTRRAIYARLLHEEQTVSGLAGPFDMSLNAVSKHIKKLEHAGLVVRRRAGREHFLKARAEPLDQVVSWVERQRRMWNQSLDRLEAELASDNTDEI